jgi:hypothetical protein
MIPEQHFLKALPLKGAVGLADQQTYCHVTAPVTLSVTGILQFNGDRKLHILIV